MSSDDSETQSNSAESKPLRVGQFRISTILSWTAVVCFLMASLGTDWIPSSIDGNIDSDFMFGIFFFAIFFAPALTCTPFLIDQLLLKNDGLVFGVFWRIWLLLCLGVYSMLMLMLATTAFSPVWKGSKGWHWFYYTLDGRAGMTLWLIYLLGVALFIAAVFDPLKAKRQPMFLVGCATCAVISIWYTIASLFLNFTPDGGNPKVFAIVPGSVGVGYSLYCAIILRNREFDWSDLKGQLYLPIAWCVGLLVSILVKYPFAAKIYKELPDEPPDGCFVVTAATRGHREFVGTWYDTDRQRLLNRQLLTFWSFESLLKSRTPRLHRMIRWFYNRIGPLVARSIVFRWQADLVYLLLKPAELLIKVARLSQPG